MSITQALNRINGYRVARDSIITEQTVTYDSTYLSGDDGTATLFVTHHVKYQTRKGNRREGSKRDVIEFATADEMAEWIEAIGATEDKGRDGVE